jgi:tetratricopeptide (TPR) repeat protein
MATTTHNLGVIHDEMKEHENALKYYEKALEMRKALAEKEPIAFNMDVCVTLLNIITLYHTQTEKSKSLDYRENALELISEAERRLQLIESDKPVIKSMKSDVEYFREFFEEITTEKLN